MSRQPEAIIRRPKWLPPDCQTCQDIWRGLTSLPTSGSPSPGVKVDLRRRKARTSRLCAIHDPLVQHLERHKGTIVSQTSITRGIPDDGIRDVQNEPRRSHWNLLVKKKGVADHPGVGHVLNPKWVDLKLARRWKDECLSSHRARCSNPMKTWPARPAWLIDVEQGCLVEGRSVDGTYVALSYIYGRKTVPIVTAGIVGRLRRAGALTGADPEVVSQFVAPIVTHAMAVTSALAERYLWADSLCIPYQDPEAMAEQLSLMGSIYASAVVTVVSLSGDAMDGLPGIEGVSIPRKTNQAVVQFGDEQIVSHEPWINPDQEWNRLPYFDRGWTYQEYLLSSRKLLFLKGKIHWVCSDACWHEDMSTSIKTAEAVSNDTDWPSLFAATGRKSKHELSKTIQKYSMKQLRYDEDALPAISGTLATLSRFFPGGFLYGIPEAFFEWGLCWTPDNATAEIRRRKPSARLPESRLHPSELPSWSWVGWQGAITMSTRFDDPEPLLSFNPSCPVRCETFAVTQWFTGASPRVPPAQRRRIYSAFRREAPMPQYQEPEPSKHPEPGLVPTAEFDEPEVPFVPDQTPFLFCNTTRTRLRGRLDHYNVVKLVNKSREPVGHLHLHTEHDRNLCLRKSRWLCVPRLFVELVAICKLRIYYPYSMQERYAVLWVEWIDGIAYRRASGEVDAKAWDDSRPEPVSLVLG